MFQVFVESLCVLRRSHDPVSFLGNPDGHCYPDQEASGPAPGSLGVEAAVLRPAEWAGPGGGRPAQLPQPAGNPAPGKQRHQRGQLPCGEETSYKKNVHLPCMLKVKLPFLLMLPTDEL